MCEGIWSRRVMSVLRSFVLSMSLASSLTFHCALAAQTAQNPLAGTWIASRLNGVVSRVTFTRAGRERVTSATAYLACAGDERPAGTSRVSTLPQPPFANFPLEEGTLSLSFTFEPPESLLVDSQLIHPGGGVEPLARDRLHALLGLGGAFVRGDVNADSRVDISDPVACLGYLFLGSATPPCLDAADAGDDGEVAIGDAIYLLSRLFTSSPPPRGPFPACGQDPTADGLACSSYAPCAGPRARDANPDVVDVLAEFSLVHTHGERIGFWQGAGFPSGYDGDLSSHFQGIQRLRAGPYFAVAGSSASVAHLFMVHLGSRDAVGRFRSNRIAANEPPAADSIVNVIEITRDFNHAGGFQVIGDYLVVGAEQSGQSRVYFYDVSVPESPRQLGYTIERPSAPAGAVGVVKRLDGRYLLLVGRTESDIIDFYVSDTTSLEDPGFRLIYTWREGELRSENGQDSEFGDYQNLDLFRQPDGRIFLVGFHRSADVLELGDDFADLFRVDLVGDAVVITKVANKHMFCRDECDFDAGAGAWVDDLGQLSFYGVEHWRHGGVIRCNEFRRIPALVDPPLRFARGGWVDLHEDVGFEGRTVLIDWIDRDLRDYSDYEQVEAFGDTASSARWVLPAGWSSLLFEDSAFKGAMLRLEGDGRIESLPRFADLGWNDVVSSSRFVREPIASMDEAWVELYDDTGFKDRRLVITSFPAEIPNYKNIDVEGEHGFGDKVSAARWQLPPGVVYRLYADDTYRGGVVELDGTGRVEEIPSFTAIGFNDKVSSSR